jgi:AcrR family transcriptional regulator
MGRPREHDDATREALLRAGEQLLSRGEPLSVRALADATATTTRAVYSLFGSMDGVHQALLARGFEELGRRVRAVPETSDPAADLVRAGLDAFRGFALEHPNLFRLGFERIVPGLAPAGEAGTIMVRALKALAARVQRCSDAGLLGGRAVRDVVWQFHAFCQGLASVELSGSLQHAAGDATALWRDALGTFVAGLAKPAPRAARGKRAR